MLGGSGTGEIEVDLGSIEPFAFGLDETMIHIDKRAERLDALDVEIDWSGANVASAGHGYFGVAFASEHRAEDTK